MGGVSDYLEISLKSYFSKCKPVYQLFYRSYSQLLPINRTYAHTIVIICLPGYLQPVEDDHDSNLRKSKPIKTNQTTVVLGAAAALIAYSLFRKGAAAGTLIFYPDRIRDFEFDGLTPVLVAGIRVQNTSNQSFTLNSLAGNVFSDNTLVGNASIFTPQTVLANSQKIFTVDIRLLPLGIVNDIIKAWQYKNFTKKIEINAMANVDNLQTEIKLNYSIGL